MDWSGLQGQVFVVEFWDGTCLNCFRTRKRASQLAEACPDLPIILVHTPEFSPASSGQFVAQVAADWGLCHPVVNDPQRELWDLYCNTYWPRAYVVNQRGQIVFDWIGEGGLAELCHAVKSARGEAVKPPGISLTRRPKSWPEIYFGMRGFENGQAPLAPRAFEIGEVIRLDGEEGRYSATGDFRLGLEHLECLTPSTVRVEALSRQVSLVLDLPETARWEIAGEARGEFAPGFGMRLIERERGFMPRSLTLTLPPGARLYTCCFSD